jgi:hypothetical protein
LDKEYSKSSVLSVLIAVSDMVQQPRRKVFHAVSFIMTPKFQSPENFTWAIYL